MRSDEYRNMAALDQRHWFFLGMKRIQLSILDSYYGSIRNLKILDAGSGTCWLTQALEKYGEVTALDISDEALRVCRARGIQNLVQSDVANTPFQDATFDLIVCSEVLYHQYVTDDSAVMKEFNRILKSGGRVLIKVPAHEYLRSAHDTVNLTRHRYEPQELKKLFTDNGFAIEKMTYANFFLFPLVYIKRKLKRSTPYTAASDITKTAAPINAILLWILSFEALLISRVNLPQGSSLICMGRKGTVQMLITGWHMPKQLFKYLLSGVTVAIFELALLYTFTQFLGMWYIFSAVIAFLFAFCLSFSLQKFWTFQDKKKEGAPKQASLYLALSVANLGFNVIALYLLVQIAGLWYIFAQVLINAAIAVWNFLLYKFVIFRLPKTDSHLN